MADRSVNFRLRADISALRAQMAAGGKSIEGLAKTAEQTSTRSSTALGKLGKGLDTGLASVNKHQASITTLGNGFGVLGLAAAAGIGVTVGAAANFDQAMSGVAASGKDASNNLDGLREAAIKAGAETKYSAGEAAGGIEALAKAGVSAKDTLGGGLSGALNLAAAGNLDVASSAEVAASAMTQFKLEGKDVPHIADLLAAGAGKAQGEVSDMAGALNQAGLVASQTGLSIEETTGTLAAFASAGLIGSDAGTSFKTMLQSLTPNSKEAAAAMEQIGLQAYDAQGNFVGITAVADQLKTGLGKLSKEQQNSTLKTIFGSDAVRAASVIYSQGGTGIQSWIDQTNDSGFAAETAAKKMDNLKGDIEQFTGSLETALIQTGSGANGVLRGITQDATGLVNTIGGLPEPLLKAGLGITAVGAAGALAVGGVSKIAVGAANAQAAFSDLSSSSPRLAKGLTGVSKAAGVAAGALIALQVAGAAQEAQADQLVISNASARLGLISLADGSKSAEEAFGSSFSGIISGVDGVSDAFSLLGGDAGFLQAAGTKFFDFTSALAGASGPTKLLKEQLGQVDEQLAQMPTAEAAEAFRVLAAEAKNVPAEDLIKYFPRLHEQLVTTAGDLGVTTLSAQDYADWMGGKVPAAITAATTAAGGGASAMAGLANNTSGASAASAGLEAAEKSLKTATGDLAKAQQKVIDNFSILRNGALDVESANNSWEESVDGVTSSVKANRSALDDQVAAGKLSKKEADARSRSLNVNTSSGRTNRKSITDAISALNDKITADFKANVQTKGLAKATDIASAALKTGRKRIDESATAAGLNRDAVKRMQDRMVLTPKELRTKVNTPGLTNAQTQVDTLGNKVRNLKDKSITVTASMKLKADRLVFDKMGIRVAGVNSMGGLTRADGGPIRGMGGPREDNIMGIDAASGLQTAWVSNREFVTNAPAYEANREAVETINAGKGRKFEVRPLADGGVVQRHLDVKVMSPANPDFALAKLADRAAATYAAAAKSTLTTAATAYAKKASDVFDTAAGAAAGKIDVNNPRGLTTYRGKTFTNLFAANLRRAEKIAGQNLRPFQGGFRPSTSYSGTSHRGDAIDAQPAAAIIRALRNVGIASGDRTGLGNWAAHSHSVPTPGAGFGAGSAIWQAQDYLRRGGSRQSLGSAWGLADGGAVRGLAAGGVVKAGSGGVTARVGEGRFDELVTPLPKGWSLSQPTEAMIKKLITEITNPIGALVAAVKAVTIARQGDNFQKNRLVQPRQYLYDTVKRNVAAKVDRNELREEVDRRRKLAEASHAGTKAEKEALRVRVARLAKEAAATKGVTKADEDLKKARQDLATVTARGAKTTNADRALKDAQNRLRSAELRVTATTDKRTKAQEQYNLVAEQAKEAADRLKTAQQELLAQQQALADSANQASSAFASPYRSKSTDVDDILQSRREGAADLAKFATQLAQLRKLGLNETDVQEIVDRGAVNGGEVAAQIITGGKKQADALNKSNSTLQLIADKIGLLAISAPQRKAYGGMLVGTGTGRSDSIPWLGSTGEMVVDAPNTRRNLGLLQHINAGGDPRHLIPSWQVRPGQAQTVDRSYHAGNTILQGVIGDPDQWLRKVENRRRDAYAMANLRGAL